MPHRTLILAGGLLVAAIANAFEVDVPPALAGQPVHESITREAVRATSESLGVGISRTALDAIVAGAVNPDSQVVPHKVGDDLNDFHLNNANTTNGQFQRSFSLIRNFVNQAIGLSRNNPRALNPAGLDLSPFLQSLRSACTRSSAICAALGGVDGLSLVLTIPPFADPHTSGASLDLLRRTLPDLARQAPAAVAEDLANLQQELNGYHARQLLGHAFHVLQDLFAHSNFIELMNDRRGPPCGRSRPASTNICDDAVGGQPQRFDDRTVGPFLVALGNDFDLTLGLLERSLGPARFARLQTGFVDFAGLTNTCPDLADLPAGFDYCHWSSIRHPALNKDKTGTDEASHASHAYASRLALLASEIMWEHYLRAAGFSAPVRILTSELTVDETAPLFSRANPGQMMTFTLAQPLRTRIAFNYSVASNGEATAGTACNAGIDFVTASTTGFFDRGSTIARVPIVVCPDAVVEGNERLIGAISGNGVVTARHFVTIVDDDRYPPPVLERVTALDPGAPIVAGGTIALVGRNFQRISYAELDGRRLPAGKWGPTYMHATLPTSAVTGSHSIRVVTPDSGASRTLSFRVGALDGTPARQSRSATGPTLSR